MSQTQPSMMDVFEAHARMDHYKALVSEQQELVDDLKNQLKEAKEELATLKEAQQAETNNIIDMVGKKREAARSDGIASGASSDQDKGLFAMGQIDLTTRPGRRFVIKDSDYRVEYKGITDGKVVLVWADGPLAGEGFFPGGDISVDEWNGDYAYKVIGYVDVKEQQPKRVEPDKNDTKADDDAEKDESWRQVGLNMLADPSIPPSLLEALGEHEPRIITIGDLVDWQKSKGDWWAKDIKGVGPEAQGKIADALEAYWLRRIKK